ITQRKQIEDEIKTINVNLQKKVDEEVAKNRDKDQLMFEQSKYISMTELLINISHHWRQPLCAIGVSIQDIKDAYIHGELDEAYITNNVNNSMSELLKLSETIDNLRNFYTQERTIKEINIADEINKAESLISGYIINKGIIINKEIDESLTVQGYQNEFTNVILNILTNAKDKFEESNITGGIIKVQLDKDAVTGKVIVSVSDNGGEISKDIINKVFEPYFTTKDKAQRTGMGLYMSKVIIEKNMKGTISVRNRDGWCEFRIEI
ncbi:MAG: HAMP domain-containing histidine kinase, partial [Nitrospirae bacterium]|nr:HAMP domain-containing histidine kinase [Nitrospirota bacterium]